MKYLKYFFMVLSLSGVFLAIAVALIRFINVIFGIPNDPFFVIVTLISAIGIGIGVFGYYLCGGFNDE